MAVTRRWDGLIVDGKLDNTNDGEKLKVIGVKDGSRLQLSQAEVVKRSPVALR